MIQYVYIQCLSTFYSNIIINKLDRIRTSIAITNYHVIKNTPERQKEQTINVIFTCIHILVVHSAL